MNYLETTEAQGKNFYIKFKDKGPVMMLNLLKFRDVADYTAFPEMRMNEPISGKEAYQLYVGAVLPHLEAAGSEVLYSGASGAFIIGPENEHWDQVILVKHRSAESFIHFAQNEGYLKALPHRQAALIDSRLLPFSA